MTGREDSYQVKAPPAPDTLAGFRERWLGVEVRHLVALLAVEQEGSFRGAAARLGYVQSAISQQIAFLEKMTGTRLVDRTPGPGQVSLTDAGTVLARRGEAIIAHLRLAHRDLGQLARGLVPPRPITRTREWTAAQRADLASRAQVGTGAPSGAVELSTSSGEARAALG